MGKVKVGEVVLIYGGISGIGIMVFMLCKVLGIKIFVIVGSDEKV